MYSISEIRKQNQNTKRDEELRLKSNYEVQSDGDVWVRHQGRLRILPAGLDAEAFLASVNKRAPGEVNVIITKLFQLAAA